MLQQNDFPLFEEVAYQNDLYVLFCYFADYPGTLWLDSQSCNTLEPGTDRYSYFAVEPFKVYTLDSQIQPENFHHSQPFAWLAPILHKFQQNKKVGLPPFQGGIAGYWSYNLGLGLENTTYSSENFYQSTTPLFALGLYDLLLAFDHLEKKAWIISTGFPEKDLLARKNRAQNRLIWLKEIYENLPKIPDTNINYKKIIKENSLKANFSEHDYQNAVKKIKEYISAGDVFQVNLSQQFSAELVSEEDYKIIYKKLRDIHHAPFAAFYHAGNCIIASASPERFIKLEDNLIETRPIKGTIRRDLFDTKNDLLLATELKNSTKDFAENTMIVDLMRNDISKISTIDSVEVKKLCGLESFQTVHHLVSVIQAKLAPQKNALDILQACFPGGSITGAPKVRAMEIIQELEPHQREPYCGSLGFISFTGDMDTSILIRTLIIQKKYLTFCVGGGIVLDSSPEAEYQETLVKAKGLLKVLGYH